MSHDTEDASGDPGGSTVPDRSAPSASTSVDPIPTTETLKRGDSIGRFLVVSKLGEGGMGVVYAAYDPELDRKVAVKLMRLADPLGAEGRLAQEARSMARLSHRNVVAVFDVGSFHDRMFMAMELVEGMTLKQWVRSQQRPQREILQVFAYAGRGLVAAHAAGLVHRDFKPANVLVGHDGRVLVGDFGLARKQRDAAVPDSAPWVSGTPAYMAPEQHDGRALDARADQFSFCVALYEALYGERPFAGDNPLVVRAAMVAGRVQPPRPGTSVPGWLRAALLKGLSSDPSLRFSSMEALLAVLADDPRKVLRRQVSIALGAVALGATLALAWRAHRAEAMRCPAEAAQQLEIWSPERIEQAHAAFLASQSATADDAWQRVVQGLESYDRAWAERWTAACQNQRGAAMESARRQRDCLQSRLSELRALTDLFTRADRQVVDHATRAVSDLTALDRCSASALLPTELAAPTGGGPLRADLVRSRVLEGAGKPEAAQSLITHVLEEAKGSGLEGVRAEALNAQAVLDFYYLGQTRPLAELVQMAREAAQLAEAAHQDEVAAQARLTVLHLLTEGPPPYGPADEAGREALAAVQRLGAPADLQAQLDKLRGGLAQYEGRFDDASRLLRASIASGEAAGHGDDLALASPLLYLGDLLRDEGRYDEARTILERALRLQERALGPRHPDLVATLDSLAQVAVHQSHWTEAMSDLERARKIAESVPDSTDLDTLFTHEATVQRHLGQLEAARTLCHQALNAHGLEELDLACVQGELGLIDLADHHPDLAVPLLEKSLAVRGQRPGDRADVAELRFGLAQASLEQGGDLSKAKALAQQAREAFSRGGETDRPLREAVERWLAGQKP